MLSFASLLFAIPTHDNLDKRDNPFLQHYSTSSSDDTIVVKLTDEQKLMLEYKEFLEVGVIFTKYLDTSDNWKPICLLQSSHVVENDDGYAIEFNKPSGLSADNMIFYLNIGMAIEGTQIEDEDQHYEFPFPDDYRMFPARQPLGTSDFYYQFAMMKEYQFNTILNCENGEQGDYMNKI